MESMFNGIHFGGAMFGEDLGFEGEISLQELRL